MPFTLPVAEIENDASRWIELLNWIGLILYHLISAGTSKCSNQDMNWMKLTQINLNAIHAQSQSKMINMVNFKHPFIWIYMQVKIINELFECLMTEPLYVNIQ